MILDTTKHTEMIVVKFVWVSLVDVVADELPVTAKDFPLSQYTMPTVKAMVYDK